MEGSKKTEDDSFFVASEARKNANALAWSGKGSAEDVQSYYDTAISIFQGLIDRQEVGSRDHYIAIYELAQTLVDKAQMMSELGLVLQERQTETPNSLLQKAFTLILSVPESETIPDMHFLLGKIAYEKSTLSSIDANEQEKLLVQSCDHLLIANSRSKLEHEPAIQLLEKVYDALHNAKKERKRFGASVYHVCGNLVRQTSKSKNFKQKFFVLDESSLSYYKSRKDWESKVTSGSSSKKPSGFVKLGEVLDISSHGKICPQLTYNAKPKNCKNSTCMHIFTKEKTINLLTLSEEESESEEVLKSKSSYESGPQSPRLLKSSSTDETNPNISPPAPVPSVDWFSALKNVWKMYKVKKQTRLVLKKESFDWDNKSITPSSSSSSGAPLSPRSNLKGRNPGKKITKRSVSWSTKTPQMIPGRELAEGEEEEIETYYSSSSDEFSSSSDEEDESEEPATQKEEDRPPIPPRSLRPKPIEKTDVEEKPAQQKAKFVMKTTKPSEGKLSKSEFDDKVKTMSDDDTVRMMTSVFEQLEGEQQLKAFLKSFVSEDPKFYVQKMANLQNFDIARFGVKQKMNDYIVNVENSDGNYWTFKQ